MIDLFSPAGLEALARLARQRALYAFDYDGTLAPIVTRPEDAFAAPTTVALLSSLGAIVPTAILTGRGVDDIRRRLAFTPLHLIGNHGAEGLPELLHRSLADSVSAHRGNAAHHETVEHWLGQWDAAIGPLPADAGIVVEPKRYSFSIHYRAAPDHDEARRIIALAIARLRPAPRLIGGKCVINVLPEDAPDKGVALATLVRHERSTAAFFIGDDVTDETVFEQAPASWVTVRVGHAEGSAARYFIAAQTDIDRCLARLVEHAEAAAPAPDGGRFRP